MANEINLIAEKFLAYLRQQLNHETLTYAEPLQQLQGGFETQTYRFQLNGADKNLSQALVLRLYPEFYGGANAVWESTIQNVLYAEGFPVARVHLVCEDLSILGGAFFIMDFLPGKLLVSAPMNQVPELLGKTQAKLHLLESSQMIRSLAAHGIQEEAVHYLPRMHRFIEKLKKIPSLSALADWLKENQPPATDQLSICHGDFHPLNILIQEEEVTAVLDWPGLLIGDPVIDVGNTAVLSTVPFKHIASTLGIDASKLDMEEFVQTYIKAYQTVRPLDTTHLAYYRVRRCAQSLLQAIEGQAIWQHPLIQQDLIEYIHKITGIQIEV